MQFSLPGYSSKAEAKREDSITEKSDSETVEDEEDTLEFPYDHFPTLGHRYVPYYSVGSKRRLIRKTIQYLKGVIYM